MVCSPCWKAAPTPDRCRLVHRLHNPARQLRLWSCKTRSCLWQSHCGDSSESKLLSSSVRGARLSKSTKMPISRVLTSSKLGKSIFPTETGQEKQLLQCPSIVDVKARARCWLLAGRGRDGEGGGIIFHFPIHFSLIKHLRGCTSGLLCGGEWGQHHPGWLYRPL